MVFVGDANLLHRALVPILIALIALPRVERSKEIAFSNVCSALFWGSRLAGTVEGLGFTGYRAYISRFRASVLRLVCRVASLCYYM